MDPSGAFSNVIASILSSTRPDAGSPEAAAAQVADSALAGPKPPLLGTEEQEFVQTYVLPALFVVIAKVEMARVVESGPFKDQPYYAPDKAGAKQLGVEVLASRYYHDNDYPDMPVRTYGGSSGDTYYHCAELVWNSAILAGFHVPMNKNSQVQNFYGFYNSANVLFDQCDRPKGVPDLATPKPEDSFKATNVFKDAKGNAFGLPGPRIGDLIVARRDQNDAGVRAPGHIALLHDTGTTPPTFLEAGVSVRESQYPLTTRAISGHDTRLVRLRNPDWRRIERWLTEGQEADDFKRYFKAKYPSDVKDKSYRGLFGLAVARISQALAADDSASGKKAKAQLTRLEEMLGVKD